MTNHTENQIFIRRLPNNATEDEITDLFDRYGLIKGIIIKPHYAFVVKYFSDFSSLLEAVLTEYRTLS